MHGPSADELTERRVETPAIALQLERLAVLADEIGRHHAATGVTWLPATPWGGCPPVADLLRRAGARGVTVAEARHLGAAALVGLPWGVVTLPPIGETAAEGLARLAGRASVGVVCDHFVQAERIAAACRRREAVADVLLRVDVGRQRLGVRPGPDLDDLCRGIARLDGVRVAGVFLGGRDDGLGLPRLGSDALGRLLARCREIVARTAEVVRVSVDSLADLPETAAGLGVTETRTPLPAGSVAAPTFAWIATVVGRPTRDLAVLNLGRGALGAARPIGLVGWPGTKFTLVSDEITVAELSPDSQDLVIGETAAVVTDRVPFPTRDRAVLVGHGSDWIVSEPAAAPSPGPNRR